MSITIGNDFDKTSISNELVGLYYYYLSQSKVNSNESSVLGFCPTIQSASYNPFIDEDDLNLMECNFDTTRFGKPNGVIPKCYRILSNPNIEKTLKTKAEIIRKKESSFFFIKVLFIQFCITF